VSVRRLCLLADPIAPEDYWMMRQTWTIAATLVAVVTMAACSGTPQTPTAPSAASGGATTAAADGSTLKVTAPALVAPIGGARVDTRRPTLSWTASTGTYAAVSAATYDVEVSTGGAVVYTAAATGTSHEVGVDAAPDTTYTWRVRARQDGAVGPWSTVGTFQSPLPTSGGGVNNGYRTPDPPPGQRLPLPNEFGLVLDEYNRNTNDWRNSCQETQGERGWVWLDKLIDRLRTRDLRWGYNGKRGNLNDLSLDIVDYHYGAGESFGSTSVYIIDVLLQHCGNNPSPVWIDQTAATAASNTIGRWGYPRSGHAAVP
jgi:hypothetical protein